jgi:uncharacterized protein
MPDAPSPDRTILDGRAGGRRFRARDALVAVGVAVALLVVLKGADLRESGERMDSGIARSAVLAVGHPAGWVADRLPFDEAADDVTAAISPDDELDGPGGFDDPPPPSGEPGGAPGAGPGEIARDAFDPTELGERPPPPRPLDTLLVTGDSLAQPLDVELARRLAGRDVETVRDVHLGTGISKTDLLDWGRLSSQQVREHEPDAVVVFIGANEGFPLPRPGGGEVECCGREWAVLFAQRARRMMETYRQRGAARLYWLTLPAPREAELARIARTVNAAIEVAAQPYAAHVRVLDMVALFTPGDRFRSSMPVGGRQTIVREPDGIHLNAAGARLAADVVVPAIERDFGG